MAAVSANQTDIIDIDAVKSVIRQIVEAMVRKGNTGIVGRTGTRGEISSGVARNGRAINKCLVANVRAIDLDSVLASNLFRCFLSVEAAIAVVVICKSTSGIDSTAGRASY